MRFYIVTVSQSDVQILINCMRCYKKLQEFFMFICFYHGNFIVKQLSWSENNVDWHRSMGIV